MLGRLPRLPSLCWYLQANATTGVGPFALRFTLPYLTSPQLALPCLALISSLAWFSPAVSVCLSVLLHRGPLPLTVHTACASLFNSCQRLCLFPSLFAWTGPFTSW